ncbi:MAG: PrsW family intramembrane metalloprotease [Brevefilum sp.]|nr:PrsW family intramembrane metalloprotease [Brevefilum sp.]
MTEMHSPGKNWRVILTLVISALGILFFIVQALALGVFFLTSFLDPIISMPESVSIGLFFWTSILGGLMLVPILLLSIYNLQGKPVPGWLDLTRPTLSKGLRWVILVWPVLVLLGWWITSQEGLAAFLLGPINVLVAGLPILWIFNAAQSGLPGGSHMRKWRIFGFSITLLPILVILAELIAIVILGGLGWVYVSIRAEVDPQIQRDIAYLANQVMARGDNLDAMIQFLRPYILQPSIIFWALAIFGGIIPIIEEVIKPLALWTLAGRKLTPQEGFVGGLLCGAGFALMENVFYFTTVLLAEEWLFMAIGRAGTGVLHMLASGLVGWGLAVAWQKRKWAFLALTTLGAFVLHGVWNIMAVISGVVPLLILESEPTSLQLLVSHAPVVVLLIMSIIGLFLINKHLRIGESADVLSTVESQEEGGI